MYLWFWYSKRIEKHQWLTQYWNYGSTQIIGGYLYCRCGYFHEKVPQSVEVSLFQVLLYFRCQKYLRRQNIRENQHDRSVENAQIVQRWVYQEIINFCHRQASQLKHETKTWPAKPHLFGLRIVYCSILYLCLQ